MSAPFKHHPYKGRHLTIPELLAQPECLSEITAKHIRVRIYQGKSAEYSIITPLGNREILSEIEALKIQTSAHIARTKLKAIMAAPIRPETTYAFYAIGAVDARLKGSHVYSTNPLR
jgi:hypothetical protein